MKRGDILFTRNNSLLSKAIRVVETGRFGRNVPSHVAVIVDGYFLIDATFRGVRKAPIRTYNKNKRWIGRMKEPRDIEKGIEYLYGQVGKQYDFMQLVGIFARTGLRLFGKKIYNKSRFIRNFLDSKQKFICAELVAIYGEETGKRLWHHHPSNITPFDLWRSQEIEFIK